MAAVIAFTVGWLRGYLSGHESERGVAIKSNLAYWTFDPDGRPKFLWRSSLYNEYIGLKRKCELLQERVEEAWEERDNLKLGLKELMIGLAAMADVHVKEGEGE